jgi:hypothetical protein
MENENPNELGDDLGAWRGSAVQGRPATANGSIAQISPQFMP